MNLKALNNCPHLEGPVSDTLTMFQKSVRRTCPYLRPRYVESLKRVLKLPVYKVTESLVQANGKLVTTPDSVHVHLYQLLDSFLERELKIIGDDRVDALLDSVGSLVARTSR